MEPDGNRTPHVVVYLKAGGKFQYDDMDGFVGPFLFFSKSRGDGWTERTGYKVEEIDTITGMDRESIIAKPKAGGIIDPSRTQ